MMRVLLILVSFFIFQQYSWSQVFYAKDLDKKQRKQYDKGVKYQKEKNYQKIFLNQY